MVTFIREKVPPASTPVSLALSVNAALVVGGYCCRSVSLRSRDFSPRPTSHLCKVLWAGLCSGGKAVPFTALRKLDAVKRYL